jgi:hypothetical protein
MTSKPWRKQTKMPKVDMSPEAIAVRLKRVSQLRRLGLSLQKAKLRPKAEKTKATEHKNSQSLSDRPK